MNVYIIARLTFMEASRRKILLAALILGLVFLLIFGLGFHFIIADVRTSRGGFSLINPISNFLMLAGLYVVNFLTSIMTVLTSVDTLSGEISSGTVHVIVSKPIRRWEVVIGKWLGFTAMISLYLIPMAGGVIGSVYAVTGYLPPNPFQGLLLMWLNALLLLSISMWGGTFLSTLANGVLVFGLYGLAFLGGWIEQIGSFFDEPARTTAINLGVLTSLLMPSEALWKRAAHELSSPLTSVFGMTPFSSNIYPSLFMIAYALLYLIVIVLLALRKFQQRDL